MSEADDVWDVFTESLELNYNLFEKLHFNEETDLKKLGGHIQVFQLIRIINEKRSHRTFTDNGKWIQMNAGKQYSSYLNVGKKKGKHLTLLALKQVIF